MYGMKVDMAVQQVDPGRIATPTQLVATVMVLQVTTISALITGAATISSPTWVPAALAIGAILEAPLALVFAYRLLTKYRRNLVNDDRLADELSTVSATAQGLDDSLTDAGIDTAGLMIGDGATNENIRSELAKLIGAVGRLERQGINTGVLPSDALLNAGKAFMAEQRWAEAAQYFDLYVRQVDADWQVHFIRGTAHANTRGGAAADTAALRAYSDAIALVPPDANPALVARLFGYRGGMERRLNRLDEAESDLLLARKRASENFEIADITYNLAAVYAMLGRKAEALAELRRLRELGDIWRAKAHVDDLFKALRDDPEFQEIVVRGDERPLGPVSHEHERT